MAHIKLTEDLLESRDYPCRDCHQQGKIFNPNSWGRRCIKCQRSYCKKYNDQGIYRRSKTVKANKLNREHKIWAIEYKGGKCLDCNGIFAPCVFDFDHRDPTSKVDNPSAFIKMSKETAMKELDKCDLVCSNCHRVRSFAKQWKYDNV